MTTRPRKPSRIMAEMAEMADAQLAIGTMDAETHGKITMLVLNRNGPLPEPEPMTGEEIKALRERSHLSQAVFAHYLNMTVGYVSKLERGATRPSGPALALLNVIRRKGIEAIL